MNSKCAPTFRFTISYMVFWVGVCNVAMACFKISLAGGSGWVVGYSKCILFTIASLLVVVLLGDPLRRIKRLFFWPLITALCLIVAASGVLFWYIESFKPILIERGIADPGKIAFKKLTLDPRHLIVVKYHVRDLPNCENTAYLTPWRDGYRSLSDDYLQSRR
jgi:hypothetical protein